MKCVQLILSAVLLTVATVWARAAAVGLEQALVSIGINLAARVRSYGYEDDNVSTLRAFSQSFCL